MTRRTTAFVSKRPHHKSRGGCLICKRKRIKCDEAQPQCGYCALRKLECIYSLEMKRQTACVSPKISSTALYQATTQDEELGSPFLQTPTWLIPAAMSSAGQLTKADLELLYHYKTVTWKSITVRKEEIIHKINRDMLPQMGMSHSYLLFALLGITAAQLNQVSPSIQNENLMTFYRHKTLTAYNRTIQNITTNNYESLLLTSMLLQVLVPHPDATANDDEMFKWVSLFLSMTQGLRILASLKWSSGIEKLSVFPIFRRELWTLPPPPLTNTPPDSRTYTPTDTELGQTPEYPNPPAPWGRPHSGQHPAPAFLPPPLLTLLHSLVDPPTPLPSSPLDLHPPIILPMLHALSPIFLSLYHFHITPDVYVRIVVFPTFMPPEFISLVKAREPRALVIIAWWFAFVRLVPNMWWMKDLIPRLLQAVSNEVVRSNQRVLVGAVEDAYRVVRLTEKRGREVGARGVFEGWEGVCWDDGGMGGVFEEK
ncbi:uncharacterized protein BDR25DRAFT_289796 [Lindgomyces ingoldianus]|uniref:Uncharacterized protein n=1 Tax=Lindgomyces ingoldianus TaxID=673940 RepID=A0ACB6QPD5_9PLEO|nr:uncharacterized protein BDR25DRAFT_289796 [Lindgomyces ingoldianus]KAF2468853.1 hypothetical protein BDR25DRAFT_289796 [Lindgomyces ingoldianus]